MIVHTDTELRPFRPDGEERAIHRQKKGRRTCSVVARVLAYFVIVQEKRRRETRVALKSPSGEREKTGLEFWLALFTCTASLRSETARDRKKEEEKVTQRHASAAEPGFNESFLLCLAAVCMPYSVSTDHFPRCYESPFGWPLS